MAGPGGMPLIGTFPAPAWPAIRANDAAGVARRRSARAIFAELFDIMDSVVLQSDRSDVVHDDRVDEGRCRPVRTALIVETPVLGS